MMETASSSRKGLLLAGGIFVLVGTLMGLWGLYHLARSPDTQVFGRIVPRVDTTDRVVALTFDDGPDPAVLDEVLTMLGALGVRATFFVNGAELERAPESGRRLVLAGHELGNHSFSHRRMVFVSPSFVRREIERTDALIRSAGQPGRIYFRPPYGKKLFVLPWFLQQTGRVSITYDLAPDSVSPTISPERIVARVVEGVRPGSIVLLHIWYENRVTSRAAVPVLVRELRGRGYSFVTVGELLSRGRGARPQERSGSR